MRPLVVTADTAGAGSATRWDEPEKYDAPAVRSDPATSHLRRLCDEATAANTRRASPTRSRTLQTAIRQLVAGRVDQRPLRGLPVLEQIPPALDAYLRADPAPTLSQQQLTRIVSSIEEL